MSHRPKAKVKERENLGDDELLRLSQLALDVSSDMCIWADKAGRILYANEMACRALGYTNTELLSMNVMDFDTCYDAKRYSQFWQKITGSGSIKLESEYVRKDGSRFPVEMILNYARVGDKEYAFNFIRDISEGKRSGAVLRESEEKFRVLAETAPVGIVLYREDLFIYTNPFIQKVLGYTKDELLEKNFWDVVHPDDREQVRARGRVRLHGLPVPSRYELKVLTKAGETHWGDYSVARIMYGGQPTVIGAFFDITERKRAEEALRESEAGLAKAQRIAHIGSYSLDTRIDRARCSDEFYRILGITPRDFFSLRSFLEYVYPEDLETFGHDYRGSIDQNRSYNGEFRIIRPDGDVRTILADGEPVLDESGRTVEMFGIIQDITERKEAEKALRESEEMFRAFAESARAEIVLIKGNRFIYVNPERIRALGYTKEELMAMNVEDTIHPDMRETVRDRVRRRLRGEPVPSQYEARMITKGGETYWEEISSTLINYKGEPTILSMSFNITARKRAEQALKDAKMQAELYLDLMSHDITNMNQALMGNLEIMEVQSETGEIDRGLIESSLKIINRSSRMISDVKKLTQVQTGKFPQRAVDVRDILESVKARYSTVPDRHITINYAPGECCMVMADDLLGDLFDNLVDNAIRHSTGPVTIDLTVDRVSLEGRRYYRVTVADTGPGIPDDLKKKIFLTMGEIGAAEKFKRRGFGLFLVRTLTDHYHGKVWVEDRVSGDYTKGAKFVVMLPVTEI